MSEVNIVALNSIGLITVFNASFEERLVYKGKDNHMQQSANRQSSDNSLILD